MKKILLFVILIFAAHNSFSQKRNVSQLLHDIEVRQIEGDDLTDIDLSAQLEGKIAIIEFWEYWCGPCLIAMPHLKDMKEKYPEDLVVIAVSSDDLARNKATIAKRSYPFIYVDDPDKKLAAIFPHEGIPHSVLIDKSGDVIAMTHPNMITEQVISAVLEGKEPEFTLDRGSGQKAEETDSNKLVSFSISMALPEDVGYSSKSSRQSNFRILTADNQYMDSLATMYEHTISKCNILYMYRKAYNDRPASGFEYPEELQYINSSEINHLYRMDFACSSLMGDAQQILIRQLNAAFGLTTRSVNKPMEVLVLTDIIPNDNTMIPTSETYNGMSSDYMTGYFKFRSPAASGGMLAGAIEAKLGVPVIVDADASVMFEFDIDLQLGSDEPEAWMELLRQNGIILEKQTREMEIVEIGKL